MDIIFNPLINEENKYIEIMVQPLEVQGYRAHPLEDIFSSWRNFREIKLVHLNWFENVDDSSLFLALKSFLRKLFVLTSIRISKKKLVWTMHNRISHENRLGIFNGIITRLLIQWSHKIIIHSQVSRSLLTRKHPKAAAKIFYLPHPDFIGNYGPLPEEIGGKSPSSPLSLLFLGAVKPYKNLEILIKAVSPFREKIKLVIAGNPTTSEYHQKIARLASLAGNIELKLKFIPDNEISGLIGKSDLLILPYDLKSSLNSGTVILAFSYRKTVICPEIGTIADLGEKNENILHYQYESDEEHLWMLSNKIKFAIQLKEKDNSIFSTMGDRMYEHIALHHNKKLVAEKLMECYRSLFD